MFSELPFSKRSADLDYFNIEFMIGYAVHFYIAYAVHNPFNTLEYYGYFLDYYISFQFMVPIHNLS